MSMDFRKTTYRPNRPHTRLRTSYGVMSKWMALSEGTKPGEKTRRADIIIYTRASPPPVQSSGRIRDFHKAYRHFDSHAQPVTFPVLGPPRLRYGRAGGSWRHVKEVMQARGKRALFVDGQMRTEDNDRLDEVPWGNMLQPPARTELLSRGYTCPAPGDFHTSRGTYPQDPTLAEPVGSGYAQDNWMAAR
ncbi:LOW QUALITY PROTEIN: uncharacterized protein LOC135471851 [Liolophura sinensis]|uniref:LOW QUALITY PROTEIN: uncharacterized protein LOC135471851 n=1 Tax=Liolophura sinensis TaxID=3198878 RepID=UPI0031580B05